MPPKGHKDRRNQKYQERYGSGLGEMPSQNSYCDR